MVTISKLFLITSTEVFCATQGEQYIPCFPNGFYIDTDDIG